MKEDWLIFKVEYFTPLTLKIDLSIKEDDSTNLFIQVNEENLTKIQMHL